MSKKVFCVDDAPAILMLLKKSLQPEGYSVVEAKNGKEALEKLNREDISSDISLFIVDVNIPVMDGFEFVKNLKSNENFKSKPVIFLTTESSARKKRNGQGTGSKRMGCKAL